jgi:sugar lactone lactonase YvrE
MKRRRSVRWAAAAACGLVMTVGFAAPAAATPAAPTTPATTDCAPADGAEFLCGAANVEQLVRVDGTRWAVGSSAAGGPAQLAPVYFLDLKKQKATALDPTSVKVAPDAKAYPGCPGPPDFANLQSLGIEYEKVHGHDRLIVISHGGGFSVQVFDMALRGGRVPALTWIGCVLPPDEHFWPDAAAGLPDGGMLVTSLYDPVDPNFTSALESGEPYGRLAEWHADSGWKDVYPGTFAGPNGVILSKGHATAYVANWSGKRVTRVDRRTGKTATVDLPMLVDNLAWNEDGTKILAGGQTDTIEQGFGCTGSPTINCNIHFAVYEIDPQTLAKKLIVGPTVLGVMGGGTGALQYHDTLWLTSYRSDRIARIPYPG